MKKKIMLLALSCLMICILALSIGPVYADQDGGLCGTDVYWSFDTDTGALSITGTGPMTAFSNAASVPWNAYAAQITAVEVGENVTSIGSYAFNGCSQLTTVSLPSTLEKLGLYVFKDCPLLDGVTLPASVTSMGYAAFQGCSSLQEITIPAGVQQLPDCGFEHCTALQTVNLSNGLKKIGSSTFSDCTALETITLPDSVITISDYAFMGCTSLESIQMPANQSVFGSLVFRDCTALTEITLHSGVQYIPQQTFYNCTSLQSVTAEGNVTSIGNYAFYNCTALQTLTLQDGLNSIGSAAFRNCQQLTGFDLPSTVRTIAGYAFYNCQALTSITVPEGVTSLGANSFSHCVALESISLPSTLTTIGDSAFVYDIALTEIELPAGLTSLGTSAFSLCYGLTEITIPAGITTIPNSLFYHCDHLETVTLLGDVTEIGNSAFYECYVLKDLELPESLERIGTYAFRCCYKLTELELPQSLLVLDEGAFYWTCFREITLPDHLTYIGKYAFCKFQSLSEITIPASVTFIGESAFTGMLNQLSSITVLSRVTEIETTALGQPGTTVVYGCGGSDAQLAAARDGYTFIDLETGETELRTNNQNAQDYQSNWASVIRSYLYEDGNGGLVRVEYGLGRLVAETYDSNYQKTSARTIPVELPLFGGFYAGETWNFFVFGQNNPDDDDAVEVVRVVRYTKDWQRVDSVSLYGANTSTPFRAGSLRMTEYNGRLYVVTSHEMYLSSDGKKHQAAMTFCVRISDMTITDQLVGVIGPGYGYVSHSFNQFLQIDGGKLLTVHHGDAYPRAVVLFRYETPAGGDQYNGSDTQVNTLSIYGSTGENKTGLRLGGFACSSDAYLIAGSSIRQDGTMTYTGQRNIFVTATAKDGFPSAGTTLNWITDYADDAGTAVSAPHLVKLSENSFLLMWTVDGTLHYCYLDGTGTTGRAIYTDENAAISDCDPILTGNKVVWYVTKLGEPLRFYEIDLSDPTVIRSAHSHYYRTTGTEPTCTEDGQLTQTCIYCEETHTVEEPALGHLPGEAVQENYVEPTATEAGGYDTVVYCQRCNAELSREHTDLDPTGPVEPIETDTLQLYSSISVGTDMVITYAFRKTGLTEYDSFWIEVVKHEPEGDVTYRYGEGQPEALTEATASWRVDFTHVFAKEMGVEIEARLCAETPTGQIYVSPALSTTLRDYLGGRLTATNNSIAQRILAADLLNYGAAAQRFMNYETDHLVTQELTAAQKAKLRQYQTTGVPAVAKTNANATPAGQSNILFNSVTLGNEVVLTLAVRADADAEVKVLVKDHTTGDVLYTLGTEYSGSSHKADFTGIGADKMRVEYDFVAQVNGAETGNIRTWSIEGYVGEIRSGNNQLKTALANALLVYGDSAAAYFAS